MKEDKIKFILNYGWIVILIFSLGMISFIVWVIIKLLQHWSVI